MSERHSNHIVDNILKLSEQGITSKEISKQSFVIYGYEIQEITIDKILKKNHVKTNKLRNRVRCHWRIGIKIPSLP